MKDYPFIEVAIVFKDIDDFILESVRHCLNLEYPNFSILLLPDREIDFPIKNKKIRIIPTGPLSIPKKRNIGIKNCLEKAELIAYVDSDAFPRKDWLTNSIKYFNNKGVMAVGGPNLTPPNEEFKRKIAGNVVKQKIAIGESAVRHNISKTHFIKELPTCNLIVRKGFLEDNLFDESLTTGEDANLCSEIIKKNYKIIYASDVIVFHHRRRIFFPFIKQFYYYGYDKCQLLLSGQLLSAYYLIPFLFFLFIIFGIIFSFFNSVFSLFFLLFLAVYFLIIFVSSSKSSAENREIFPTTLSVFLAHLSYGFGFLNYFFQKIILRRKKESKTIDANK